MKGPACREMTPREVQELGATDLTLRLHLFGESKKRTHVFLSILPGALTELSNRLGGLTERQSFLTLSYDVQHPTLDRNKGARISPPADPGRNYATYSLGLINTIAMPTATDDMAPIIDPKQCMTSIK